MKVVLINPSDATRSIQVSEVIETMDIYKTYAPLGVLKPGQRKTFKTKKNNKVRLEYVD